MTMMPSFLPGYLTMKFFIANIPAGVEAVKLSVSKFPFADSAVKCDLMNSSALAWSGDPTQRCGAAEMNCFVRSYTACPLNLPAVVFGAPAFCAVTGFTARRTQVTAARCTRECKGLTLSLPLCGVLD